MRALTHVSCAELVYLLFFTTAGVSLSAGNAAAVAFASILPDIDSGGSRVGRLCPPLTRFLERKFGHRTLTHSLFLVAIFFLVLLVPVLNGYESAACFLMGYATHPFLDTCTPNGVRLFFPFSRVRCVFPFDSSAPHSFRIESGSTQDTALGILICLACIPALYVAGVGYERFIRLTQHSVESAVRDYESFSPSAAVYVVMRGRSGLSGEILEGRFPVAGALDSHTLVFVGPDGWLHTVGRDFQAEYTAENVVCEKGEPATIVVRHVDMRYRELGELGADSVESYFFGDIATVFDVPLPARPRTFSPLEGGGKRIRLRFARKSDIESLGLSDVLATSGAVVERSVVRQLADTGAGRKSAGAGGTIVTCTVNPGEKLDIRARKGCALKCGDTLAVRLVPAFFREEAALSGKKLAVARKRNLEALNSLDRTIAGAISAAAADSAEYAGTVDLARRGFLSSAVSRKAEAKKEKSARALERLVGSRATVVARSAVEEERLRLAATELRARATVHDLKCDVLSPVPGTLAEIRREVSGVREKVHFVIRGGVP